MNIRKIDVDGNIERLEGIEAFNNYCQEMAQTFTIKWTDLYIFNKNYEGNYYNSLYLEQVPLNKLQLKDAGLGNLESLSICAHRVGLSFPDIWAITIQERLMDDKPAIVFHIEDIKDNRLKYEAYLKTE